MPQVVLLEDPELCRCSLGLLETGSEQNSMLPWGKLRHAGSWVLAQLRALGTPASKKCGLIDRVEVGFFYSVHAKAT